MDIILSSIVFLIPFGLPSSILDLDQTWWLLALSVLVFFYIFIFLVMCPHCQFESTHDTVCHGECWCRCAGICLHRWMSSMTNWSSMRGRRRRVVMVMVTSARVLSVLSVVRLTSPGLTHAQRLVWLGLITSATRATSTVFCKRSTCVIGEALLERVDSRRFTSITSDLFNESVNK